MKQLGLERDCDFLTASRKVSRASATSCRIFGVSGGSPLAGSSVEAACAGDAVRLGARKGVRGGRLGSTGEGGNCNVIDERGRHRLQGTGRRAVMQS